MQLDRKGIPKEIKSLEHREEKPTMYAYAWEQNIMLASYIDKKKSGKKNVVELTTMHDTVRVTKDERRKPDVHVTYNHTKGRVDIVDLISTHNLTRTIQKGWPLYTFAFLLDTTRTNAKTILSELQSPVKLSSFEFTYRLGKMLVLPNIDRRYSNSNGLTIDLVQSMRRVLGIAEVNCQLALNPDSTQGRCHVCVENIVDTPNYKNDCEHMNHRLMCKARCAKCQGFICKKQTAVLCQSCKDTGN